MKIFEKIKSKFKPKKTQKLLQENKEVVADHFKTQFYEALKFSREDLLKPQYCTGNQFISNMLLYLGVDIKLAQNSMVINKIKEMIITSNNIEKKFSDCILRNLELSGEDINNFITQYVTATNMRFGIENLNLEQKEIDYDKLEDMCIASIQEFENPCFGLVVKDGKITCFDINNRANKVEISLDSNNTDIVVKEQEVGQTNENNCHGKCNITVYNKFDIPMSKENIELLYNGNDNINIRKNSCIRNSEYPYIVEYFNEIKEFGWSSGNYYPKGNIFKAKRSLIALNNLEEISSLDIKKAITGEAKSGKKISTTPAQHFSMYQPEVLRIFKNKKCNRNFKSFLEENTVVGKSMAKKVRTI